MKVKQLLCCCSSTSAGRPQPLPFAPTEHVIDRVASAPAAEAQAEIKAEEADDVDEIITSTRTTLQAEGHMALGHLVYASLDHASMAISHPDLTFCKAWKMAKSKTSDEWRQQLNKVTAKVKGWAARNPVKVTLMVIGLAGTSFKAKTISHYMLDTAVGFCAWSKRQNLFVRFWGFVALMSIRLVVSTLVPPTSPAFGIIIQAATPDEEKWTAMPCFLVASAVAGVWPWLFDKLLQILTGEDFRFTMAAKRFADNYPLTCWTGPAMREAFYSVNGHGDKEHGKLGASFAVIVGHVVPFMGAQTTIIQRYFLPHPADSILSQPFGMTEDLVSMAMAEALSNPMLASASLTVLIVVFNLARGLVFSGQQRAENQHQHSHSFINKEPETSAQQDIRDYPALAGAALNILVGFLIACMLSEGMFVNYAFFVVAFQMMIQLLIVPIALRHTFHLRSVVSNRWTMLAQSPPESDNFATVAA